MIITSADGHWLARDETFRILRHCCKIQPLQFQPARTAAQHAARQNPEVISLVAANTCKNWPIC
jgi:hypothetical protein